MSIDWSKSKYFKEEEFKCSHSGKIMMMQGVVDALNNLREEWGKPMILSSAYRDPTHPVEARKIAKGGNAGQHSKGTAVDILCAGEDAYKLLNLIIEQKVWTGIGISQRSPWSTRFIHVDQSKESNRPTIWSY